jgi:hypothetical protein
MRVILVRVESDPVEMADRYGLETTFPEWSERLVCPKCSAATSTWW